MCGIVGYTGPRAAGPILLEGLRRLEYRGYDSAGIALVTESGELFVEKRAGKLANLRTALLDRTPNAGIGLAHTRWATHGRPNDLNAHPHVDCTGTITVVHNGIIENFRELRDGLESRGHVLSSETDTEALAHLVEEAYAGDLGDVVDLRPTGATITAVDGAPLERLVTRVDWTPEAAEKGGFDHFMLKEIHEQPQALRQCLAGRLGPDGTIRTDELAGMAALLAAVDRVEFVACGSAAYAALVGAARPASSSV